MSDDPLVSIDELARTWRTTPGAIVREIAAGRIPTLDGGALAEAGRLDVPVTRGSWANAARQDSPGAVRRIDVHAAPTRHPAATAALDLHMALSARDHDSVAALSSRASVAHTHNAEGLTEQWLSGLGDIFDESTGIATGVYALVPERGVGVRIVKGIGPLPELYDRATPVDAAGLFVLVLEDERWVADLPLTSADIDYASLLHSAPPADWTQADGPIL